MYKNNYVVEIKANIGLDSSVDQTYKIIEEKLESVGFKHVCIENVFVNNSIMYCPICDNEGLDVICNSAEELVTHLEKFHKGNTIN